MNDAVKQVLARLDALAAKLGVTAQYMWGVLVRQGRVEGFRDLGAGIVCLAVAFVLTILFRRFFKAFDENVGDDGPFVGILVSGLGAFILGVVGLSYLYSGVGELANPEFWALHQVLELLK